MDPTFSSVLHVSPNIPITVLFTPGNMHATSSSEVIDSPLLWSLV